MSATHEVDDSEFEKWWDQFKVEEFRRAESGWTDKEIAKFAWQARANLRGEQAALQSPEIQALRSDSERMRAALKRISAMDSMSYHTLDSAKITAKAAMEKK